MEAVDVEAGHENPVEDKANSSVPPIHSIMKDWVLTPNDKCIIYPIPEWEREQNGLACYPHMICIGPVRCCGDASQYADPFKRLYFEEFLRRTNRSCEELTHLVMGLAQRAKTCYRGHFRIRQDYFERMDLFGYDVILVIQFLLRFYTFHEHRGKDDPIFSRTGMLHYFWLDLFLLENQLPLFVIEEVFNRTGPNFLYGQCSSISQLALSFLQFGMKVRSPPSNCKIDHFLDLFRRCLAPRPDDALHVLEDRVFYDDGFIIPNATELSQAGVDFGRFKGYTSLELLFRSDSGCLLMPKLNIAFSTDAIIRNLILFDRYHCSVSYINDFIVAVDHLINTSEDVDLLAEAGILESWVSDSKTAADIVNNLGSLVIINPTNFYFSDLCTDMKRYCKNPWNKNKAVLRQRYFNTPRPPFL